jgi:hypothetical protein
MEVAMALRNITIPVAALLFATALAFTPALAAPAGSNAGNQSSSGGGGSHSGGGGSHSGGGSGHASHSGGGHATGGAHFAGHRSGGGSHRSHRSGGFFFGFGAPYPSYYGDESTIVCRYRRVRSHGRWVRRRYCWRQYW